MTTNIIMRVHRHEINQKTFTIFFPKENLARNNYFAEVEHIHVEFVLFSLFSELETFQR